MLTPSPLPKLLSMKAIFRSEVLVIVTVLKHFSLTITRSHYYGRVSCKN